MNPPGTAERSIFARMASIASTLAGLSILGLVVVQGWQVVARYGFNDSPGWTEPVALLLLASAMSFGAAAGVQANAHFGFFLLAQAAAPRWRRAMARVSHAVVAMIGAVLAAWSARLFVDGLGIPMAGTALPQSANYAPLAVGGALMSIFAVNRFLRERA